MPKNGEKNQPRVRKDKPLPQRVFPRGNQGTFIYSPDIAVYVDTAQHGIVDLSEFITQFTVQRNVNQLSTFMCSFDNKFSRYDRVIRRMDKIVVFMKRVQWVQVFSGYITMAPWETVVPGDAQLLAECTLKRIVHTYWDPHSMEAQKLFPALNVAASTTQVDSGSGASMWRLLTIIGGWPEDNIHVQKIPEKWLAQAASIMKQTEDEQINDPDYQVVVTALTKLLGEQGDNWLNYRVGEGGGTIGDLLHITTSGFSTDGGIMEPTGVDEEWRKMTTGKNVGQYPPNFGTHLQYVSGFADDRLVSAGMTTSPRTGAGKEVRLRADAAASLRALNKQEHISLDIQSAYMSYADQKSDIQRVLAAHSNNISVACGSVPCPAGISDHGWGTAIDFRDGKSPSASVMNEFGWISLPDGDGGTGNPNHWVFVGNYEKGYPAYATAADKPQAVHGGGGQVPRFSNTEGQFDWDSFEERDTSTNTNAFKTAYFWPGFDPMSQALTGKRAWINDVPLMESIADLTSACLRDFQSAPNGDFVAFFPDRLGIYGKFPTMQVRDIEITDFKLSVSDRNLVTHYVSVADMTNPEPHTGIDLDVFINAGYVTVEQPQVMRLLLGLPEDKVPHGLGRWMMEKFGIRPRRDDNMDIWSPGFNYMIALHRFQEAWAAQWNALVGFTYLPELYPGMRIELVNYNLSVYVEQVVHSGDRRSGFRTTATVSTPMTKRDGKWKLLSMEFDPAQFDADTAFADDIQVALDTAVQGLVEAFVPPGD